jgi:hypothetical protein
MTTEQRRDLLEIMEDRHGRGSTMVTSQLPVEHWHEIIGDPTLADAILDRLCTMLTGSHSRARASEKQPPSVRSLTTSLPTDLMMPSTREPAQQGGRDHRNPWPASIGKGGRLRAESPADFVGMRINKTYIADCVMAEVSRMVRGRHTACWRGTPLAKVHIFLEA